MRRRHRAAQSRGDLMVHPTSTGARRGERPLLLRFYQLSMSEERRLLLLHRADREEVCEREREREGALIGKPPQDGATPPEKQQAGQTKLESRLQT